MSVMGRFAKLDSALQRGLDNSFAFVFGGKVVPPEIEELLKQEIEDNLIDYDNYIEGPNVFHVGVSSKDLETLSQQDERLPQDFADQMARYCRNKQWIPAGPVVVRISEESGLRTGQLRVSSYSEPDPTEDSGFDRIDQVQGHAPEQNKDNPTAKGSGIEQESEQMDANNLDSNSWNTESAAGATEYIPVPRPTAKEDSTANGSDGPSKNQGPRVSLLLQDGSSRTYMVREGSNIIGRSNDADFRLPDTGVSRQHAEITWDGRDAVLVDLQSTNGTTVNDTPVDNWLLADGDVITLGHSHIEVRVTWPRQN